MTSAVRKASACERNPCGTGSNFSSAARRKARHEVLVMGYCRSALRFSGTRPETAMKITVRFDFICAVPPIHAVVGHPGTVVAFECLAKCAQVSLATTRRRHRAQRRLRRVRVGIRS